MVHDCWLVRSELSLQTLLTSRGPDGGLRVAPDHGSLTGGVRSYGSGAGRPGTVSWIGAACSGYRSRRASGCGADQAAATSALRRVHADFLGAARFSATKIVDAESIQQGVGAT